MGAATWAPSSLSYNYPVVNLSSLNPQSSTSPQFINFPPGSSHKGVRLRLRKLPESGQIIKAVSENEGKEFDTSPSRDDRPPFEILPGGKKVSLDEYDIVTFLYSPVDLIPSHNAAAYLWEKISDIPEESRHRLLYLLNPRLVGAAWDIAGTRYANAELAKLNSSSLLSGENDAVSFEFWNCRKSGGAMPFALVKTFNKVLFRKDGNVYGRLVGDSLFDRALTVFKPLYFTVKEVKQVKSTEEPCDLAYDFGDGLLDLDDYPQGFPKPEKHPWPFNNQVVIYIRHVGPGVMIGRAWIEGLASELPELLCNEILMVKDYSQR